MMIEFKHGVMNTHNFANPQLRKLAEELHKMGAEMELQYRAKEFRLKAVFIVPKMKLDIANELKAAQKAQEKTKEQ
ncbi:hypothetical protein FACS189487_05610 [Campylobacterota bacterium]|nr:hypothetical protein FACS189487_05610 [Campylobacterota bacterium]